MGPIFGLHAVGKRKLLPVTLNYTAWPVPALCARYKYSASVFPRNELASGILRLFFRPRVDVQLCSFFDLDTRLAWVVNASPRNDPISIHCTGSWVGQGRSGWARKISPPTGIRSPDRQARSQSLYWLSYPGPLMQPLLILIGLMSSQTGRCLPVHQVECRAEMDTSFVFYVGFPKLLLSSGWFWSLTNRRFL